MQVMQLVLKLSLAICIAVAANMAASQSYPNRVIKMVTSEPGGGSDFAARLIAQALPAGLGQQVVVDNRSGGLSAAEVVSKAAPDGYTVLVYGSTLWIQPFLRDNTAWDPIKDFAPITLAVSSPSILVVHPSLPVKSVKELITLAKAHPNQLNYGSGAAGSAASLAGALFNAMANVKVTRINYRGSGPALNGIITGEVQLMFPTAGSVAAHIKSGRLKGLAVTSLTKSELIPNLPTVAADVPGFESRTDTVILVPAGTPAAIVNRLHQEIVKVINRPEMKARFLGSGVEVVGNTPEQLSKIISTEMVRLGKVIKDAGIRDQ